MSTLTKFKELKKQQAAEERESQRRYKEEKEYHAKERRQIYNTFVNLIKPFHNQTINKHKIVLKFHDHTNSIEMFIDGKLYTTFIAETEYHHCNCSECADGQTGHKGSYSHTLNTFVTNRSGERKAGPYFCWYDAKDEDGFAGEFDRFIEKYDSDLRWNKLSLADE